MQKLWLCIWYIIFDPSFNGESEGNVRLVSSPDINREDFIHKLIILFVLIMLILIKLVLLVYVVLEDYLLVELIWILILKILLV